MLKCVGRVERREAGKRGVRFHEILLEFGQDVFPVCVLAQCTHVGLNLEHQHFPLVRLCHVYHLLDHIVCELVLHHGVEGPTFQRTG